MVISIQFNCWVRRFLCVLCVPFLSITTTLGITKDESWLYLPCTSQDTPGKLAFQEGVQCYWPTEYTRTWKGWNGTDVWDHGAAIGRKYFYHVINARSIRDSFKLKGWKIRVIQNCTKAYLISLCNHKRKGIRWCYGDKEYKGQDGAGKWNTSLLGSHLFWFHF